MHISQNESLSVPSEESVCTARMGLARSAGARRVLGDRSWEYVWRAKPVTSGRMWVGTLVECNRTAPRAGRAGRTALLGWTGQPVQGAGSGRDLEMRIWRRWATRAICGRVGVTSYIGRGRDSLCGKEGDRQKNKE